MSARNSWSSSPREAKRAVCTRRPRARSCRAVFFFGAPDPTFLDHSPVSLNLFLTLLTLLREQLTRKAMRSAEISSVVKSITSCLSLSDRWLMITPKDPEQLHPVHRWSGKCVFANGLDFALLTLVKT